MSHLTYLPSYTARKIAMPKRDNDMTGMQQVIAFIMTGGVNTAFGYGLYALFLMLGMNYALSLLLATCLGILFNFKITGKFVFNNQNNSLLFKFIMAYIFSYGLNIVAIYLLEPLLNNLYLSGFIALILSVILTFILNKYFVFTPLNATKKQECSP